MACSAYLIQRQGTYYFRLRVPSDIKHWFNRDEIRRSLRTRKLTTAKRLVNLWSAKAERTFMLMRSGVMKPHEIVQLAEQFLKETLDKNEEFRCLNNNPTLNENAQGGLESDHGYHPDFDNLREELTVGQFKTVKPLLDEFLKEKQLKVDKQSVAYVQLCRHFTEAYLESILIDEKRDLGDYGDRYYLQQERESQPISEPLTTTSSSEPVHLLSEAIERYLKDNRSKHGSISEYTNTCNRFVWILGDKDIKSYTREEMRYLVEVVKQLPNDLNNKMYNGKSHKDVLAMDFSNKLAVATSNEHIRLVKAVFEWASNERWITDNVTKVLNFDSESKKTGEKARKRYTREDLKKLTDSFHEETKRLKNRPERFWIPLIAMYSGMRLNEICQLQIDHVCQCLENNLWYFDVKEVEGVTSVKTVAGVRRVPIHPLLIDLGFIGYFKKVKASGATQVWPNLKQTQRGYKRAFDNWFNGNTEKPGFNRRFVTADEKKSFHSTRHAFRDELKQLRADSEIAAEIVGHAYGMAITKNYTLDMLVELKFDELKKVTYGLDLSHLKVIADQYL